MTNIAQKPSDIVTLIKSEFQKVNDRFDALNESVNKEFLELNKRIARVEEAILMATDEETLLCRKVNNKSALLAEEFYTIKNMYY